MKKKQAKRWTDSLEKRGCQMCLPTLFWWSFSSFSTLLFTFTTILLNYYWWWIERIWETCQNIYQLKKWRKKKGMFWLGTRFSAWFLHKRVPGSYTSSERLGNTYLNCLAWKNKGCWVSPRLKRLLTTLAAFEHYLLHCLPSLIFQCSAHALSAWTHPPTHTISL